MSVTNETEGSSKYTKIKLAQVLRRAISAQRAHCYDGRSQLQKKTFYFCLKPRRMVSLVLWFRNYYYLLQLNILYQHVMVYFAEESWVFNVPHTHTHTHTYIHILSLFIYLLYYIIYLCTPTK